MFKALLKKQLLELNSFYFQDKKTGKRRSKGGTVGVVVLYVILFLVLAGMFAALSASLAPILIELELDWLYFAMTGLLSVFLGVFGGVFNTYAGLYHARDNELLLSMPVPPAKILLVRMVGVYLMGFMYEALVFVPAIAVYLIFAEVTAARVILPIILLFVLGFFVLVLTCALGWVVALIASRLKNKSFITVIISLAFIAVYYIVSFRINTLLQDILLNIDKIGEVIKSAAYPFYIMGLGASGNILCALLFTLFAAVILALTVYILSRSFVSITTRSDGAKKAVYREKTAKAGSIKAALLRKELKRFTSSATYMLNCGLGIVMLLLVTVLIFIRGAGLREALVSLSGEGVPIMDLIPVGIAAAVCLVISMNCISAPSVSLEGKSIWIAQTLPVRTSDVLFAKEHLHVAVNIIPALVCTAALDIFFGVDVLTSVLSCVLVSIFICFAGLCGLALNLKKPNLSWTSETVPIKQGLSVGIALFGGWIVAGIIFVLYLIISRLLVGALYLVAVSAVLGVLSIVISRWIGRKGAAIFEEL